MTNPTSNYGFVLPTATDLVTDLPADFEVALQGVDTRLKALQPGTTLGDLAYSSATANTNTRLPVGTNGQVLAVVAGVPAWQNGTTGDIEGVTAGVGISGGGTSGTVTVTNSMATAITTAGDLIKGTGSGTFDRLGIGSTGQVLTVSAGAPAWATPVSGSLTLLSTTTLTSTSVTVSSISGSYANLYIRIDNLGTGTAAGICRMTVNSVTSYLAVGVDTNPSGVFSSSANIPLSGNRNMKDTGGDNKVAVINIYNYAATGTYKAFNVISGVTGASGGDAMTSAAGNVFNTGAITSVTVSMSAGTFDGSPSMKIYGVN